MCGCSSTPSVRDKRPARAGLDPAGRELPETLRAARRQSSLLWELSTQTKGGAEGASLKRLSAEREVVQAGWRQG